MIRRILKSISFLGEECKFGKAVVAYGLSTGMARSISVLLLPVVTRIFSPAEYGLIDLVTVTVSVLSVLGGMEIYSAVARIYYVAEGEERRYLISSGLFSVLGLSVMLTIAVIGFPSAFWMLLFENIQSGRKVCLLAMCWMPLLCLNGYLSVMLRFENRPVIYFGITMVQTTLKAIMIVYLTAFLKWGVVGYFVGMIMSDFTAMAAYLCCLRKMLVLRWSYALTKRLLKFSAPLTFSVSVGYINGSANRYVMLRYLSIDAIGLYAVAFKVVSIIGMIDLAFRMAWEPFMYGELAHSDHKKTFVRIYAVVLAVMTLIVIVISLFAREIVLLVATERYSAAYPLIGFLGINAAVGIWGSIVGIGPLVREKTQYVPLVNIVGMAVNVGTMLYLIPTYGIEGAAWSLMIGGLTTFTISWQVTQRLYRMPLPVKMTVMALGLMILAAGLNGEFSHFSIGARVAAVPLLMVPMLIYFRADGVVSCQ